MSNLGVAPGTSDYCVNGHLYADGNVTYYKGTRQCVTCAKARARRARERDARRRALARTVLAGDTSWREKAGCCGADPRLFDSLSLREATACGSNPESLDRVQVALSYCDVCPVMQECRRWAEAKGEQGVWGGGYLSRESRDKTKGVA